jgi:hypothetical protein
MHWQKFFIYTRWNTENCGLTASLLTETIWATGRWTNAASILYYCWMVEPLNRRLTTVSCTLLTERRVGRPFTSDDTHFLTPAFARGVNQYHYWCQRLWFKHQRITGCQRTWLYSFQSQSYKLSTGVKNLSLNANSLCFGLRVPLVRGIWLAKPS